METGLEVVNPALSRGDMAAGTQDRSPINIDARSQCGKPQIGNPKKLAASLTIKKDVLVTFCVLESNKIGNRDG